MRRWQAASLSSRSGRIKRSLVQIAGTVVRSGGEKIKRPYYIHRHDDEPLLIPAVGKFSALGDEPGAGEGFRIITADSQGGMLDVHDRRPVVFQRR